MKLVVAIDPTSEMDEQNNVNFLIECDGPFERGRRSKAGGIKCGNPAIARISLNINEPANVCAEHAAEIVRDLAPILGSWAAEGAHDKVGRWAPG